MSTSLPGFAPYVADDNLVFHYTSASTALEYILATEKLRLSPVGSTNDPGDAPPFPRIIGDDLRGTLEAAEGFHAAAGDHKLACFTRDLAGLEHGVIDSTRGWAKDRMWAQYAEQHRGVCIAFDRRHLEATAATLAAPPHKTVHVGNVTYDDAVQVPTWSGGPVTGGTTRDRFIEWEGQALSYYFAKRKDWAAESEYRILVLDYSGEGRPYEMLPVAEAIKFIVVGAKFSPVYEPCIGAVCDKLQVPSYRYVLKGRAAGLSRCHIPYRLDGRHSFPDVAP